jgi:hypothetical protein
MGKTASRRMKAAKPARKHVVLPVHHGQLRMFKGAMAMDPGKINVGVAVVKYIGTAGSNFKDPRSYRIVFFDVVNLTRKANGKSNNGTQSDMLSRMHELMTTAPLDKYFFDTQYTKVVESQSGANRGEGDTRFLIDMGHIAGMFGGMALAHGNEAHFMSKNEKWNWAVDGSGESMVTRRNRMPEPECVRRSAQPIRRRGLNITKNTTTLTKAERVKLVRDILLAQGDDSGVRKLDELPTRVTAKSPQDAADAILMAMRWAAEMVSWTFTGKIV